MYIFGSFTSNIDWFSWFEPTLQLRTRKAGQHIKRYSRRHAKDDQGNEILWCYDLKEERNQQKWTQHSFHHGPLYSSKPQLDVTKAAYPRWSSGSTKEEAARWTPQVFIWDPRGLYPGYQNNLGLTETEVKLLIVSIPHWIWVTHPWISWQPA